MQDLTTSSPGSARSVLEERYQRLFETVQFYRLKLEQHPISDLIRAGNLPENILREFSRIQYVDSILWVPMLSLIKGKIKSPRLTRAVRENIICETGINGTPHTTLCKDFVESLGEPTFYGDTATYAPGSSFPVEVMNGMVAFSEAQIAGWLMAAETLVPIFFALFRPAFAQIKNVDMRYLDEHIAVDADEHAQWMNEAVIELLQDEECYRSILSGIDIGGRVTLSIPDLLYSKAMRSPSL